MDSTFELYVRRAQNEINLSKMILMISKDETIQEQVFSMPKDTYFSAVISHAYYSIFYMAKAYLLTKGIKTGMPKEHRKTYGAFEKLVQEGVIDVELLRIYQQMMVRADTLLMIFGHEKGKRGRFTYRTLPQANKDPAEESLINAETFFKHVDALCVGK